ncbi:MAG: dockerin type I repeat-containing protein, partial [Muribaculaceae bacterium]|nr:dockerin type I repeat-containing protein [Muribaculaceae bacterium]
MTNKLLKISMFLCAFLVFAQVQAASINSLQVTVTMDEGTEVQDIPSQGMPVIDLTDGGTETDATFIINGFVAQTSGNVQDVSLVGTVYKASRTPDGWRSIGGKLLRTDEWGLEDLNVDILEDLTVGETYFFEFYVEGTDTSGNKFYYSNGGSNYKLKFTKGDGTKDVDFLSGSMTIVRDGSDYLEFGFTSQGFYGPSNQLGTLNSLVLDGFDVVLKCAEGHDVNDLSLQYKVYPVGSSGGWGRIDATQSFEDDGEKVFIGSKLNFDLLQNTYGDGDYVLEIMIQAIDENGKYHFLGKDDGKESKFYFTLGGSGSFPQIVSLIINSTFNGETDDRYIDHTDLNGEDVGEVSEFKINKISAWTIDDESLLESMWIDYHIYELGKTVEGWNQISLTNLHNEEGEWAADNVNLNILQGLTPGKKYAFEFNLVGWDGNNHFFYRTDGNTFRVHFTVKGSSFEQGDVNGDGVVSGADVTALYNVLLDDATPNGDADVNGDGVVSGADVTALYNILLNDKPVDKVYILGEPAGGWDSNKGLEMQYDKSNKVYTATIHCGGDAWFGFTTKLSTESNAWDEIAPYRFGAV